jgi:hypothetical protein
MLVVIDFLDIAGVEISAVTHSNLDIKGSLLSKSMSGHGGKMKRGDEKRKSVTWWFFRNV